MKKLVVLLSCFSLSGTAFAAPAPKPKANLYIVTNAGTTLVANFADIDACKRASKSLVVRSAPVVSNGTAPLYVTSVCINNQ